MLAWPAWHCIWCNSYVLNTYTRFDGYNVMVADENWMATKDFWADLQAEWDRLAKKRAASVTEEAATRTVISARVMQRPVVPAVVPAGADASSRRRDWRLPGLCSLCGPADPVALYGRPMADALILVRHPPVNLARQKRCYGQSDPALSRAGQAMIAPLVD